MMSRIFPFLAIVIAIGLFFGYMKPTWQTEIAQAKAQIDTYEKALEAAREFNNQIARLQEEQSKIPPEQLERLRAFLPDGVDNIQLILDLTELADRSGIELSNFDTPTPGAEGENDGEIQSSAVVESLEMTVDAEGTYDDFRAFLDGIERSLRPLDVRAVTIGNSDTGVYTYKLTLEFYWLH